MNPIQPFALPLLQQAFGDFERRTETMRRLSDMAGSFADEAAVQALQQRGDDPIIYRFDALRDLAPDQKLLFGLTTIYAGTIGGEYYMTKGHFHDAVQDGDEVYMVMQGRGHLLLQGRDGSAQTIAMQPGSVYYTPSRWAHRTVNSGEEPLVFLSIWAADVQYDYATIQARGGFPQRVIHSEQGATIVKNTRFQMA